MMVSTATTEQLTTNCSKHHVDVSSGADDSLNVFTNGNSQIPLIEKSDIEKTVGKEEEEEEEEEEEDICEKVEETSQSDFVMTDDGDTETSSIESNLGSNGLTVDEIKVSEQIIEKKAKRKYYWYGNHKLVKPIKDIPPRFQLMLAETNAEKVRCEGRPIILQQLVDHNRNDMNIASTSFNPDAQCFIPHQIFDKNDANVKDMALTMANGVNNNSNSDSSSCSSSSSSSASNGIVCSRAGCSTVINGARAAEMLPPVSGANVPFTPGPVYTIHIYNSPNTAVANANVTPTSSPCCMHASNSCTTNMYAPSTNSQQPLQAPVYYTSQPYSQPTYATAEYQPFTHPTATNGQSIQYTPCVTYPQNHQYSLTPMPH